MTGTSEELKQAWIKAWVAYGFGDYEVASKRFQFWLQRFNAERQNLSPYWSPRMQANCEQLLAEISRHMKPARRAATPIAEQQRINSAFWAGRHLMVMLSRQERTMEGMVAIVKPSPSGERLTSAPTPPPPAPTAAPRAARPAPPPPAPPAPAAARPASPAAPAPARQSKPVKPAPPPPPPVVEEAPVVVELPVTPAAPPPVEVAAAPALTAPPALESEPTLEDIGGGDLEELSLDDLDLSELDGDLDLGDLDLDEASLEDLDMEGLEDLEGIEGLEGLDDLELDGNLDELDLGEI